MASTLAASLAGKVSDQDASFMTFLARIGVVHSDKQVAVRKTVLTPEVLAQLDAVDVLLGASSGAFIGGETPNADDTLVAAAVVPIVNVILEPSERSGKYAKVAAWCDAMAGAVEGLGEHAAHYSNKQRIGRQIDVYADSTQVRALADECVALNAGYKKAKSQRQKEKDEKEGTTAASAAPSSASASAAAAAAPAAPEKVEFSLGDAVAADLSLDDKIAAVAEKLESLDISHTLVKHDAAKDAETLAKVLEAESGVKCKNLFLKAKKPKDETDSGLWLVVCPGDAVVDLKALQKHLGYPSNKELRFAREGE
jgi:hypothetical protein